MKFTDRLEYIDQCVAGEEKTFQTLLSEKVFDAFDRSYEVFRDYVHQKNTVTNIECSVNEDDLTLHITSKTKVEELLSDNLPKKGIIPVKTSTGVDLHIKINSTISLLIP